MRTKEEIIQWFREHKCLNLYIRSAHNCRRWSDEYNPRWSSIEKAIEYYHNDMINRVMVWSSTPEGYDFWRNIHNEFIEFWNVGEGYHMNG